MAERDANHLAAVLENVDITDVGQAAELIGAIPPDFDEIPDVIDALLSE